MPYLTVEQYIARFGERETILLTSETPGAATYESAKVEAAIDDADDVVEAYIGARYVVPIAGDPPSVVRGWTAALAREALYVNVGKVSDAVKEAADRARAQLRDVQAGKMSLPIAEGGSPLTPSNSSGMATSSNDRDAPVFSGTGSLDGYMTPFSGGYSPCWRRGS